MHLCKIQRLLCITFFRLTHLKQTDISQTEQKDPRQLTGLTILTEMRMENISIMVCI